LCATPAIWRAADSTSVKVGNEVVIIDMKCTWRPALAGPT
jgi:hypothetical protein